MKKAKVNEPIETTEIPTFSNVEEVDTRVISNGAVQDEQYRTLKNGALYDMNTKRIVKAPPVPPINAENARELQKLAIAKKRQVIAEASNMEVQDMRLVERFGDYAYIAEGAVNMQRLATSPEAGKAAVMAWESLIRNTGHDEKLLQQLPQGAAATVSLSAAGLGALVELLAGRREIIDADVIPMSNDLEADDG